MKKYVPLAGVDLTVAQTLRLGMDSGTFLQIEYVYGFEMFGSYETFRGGWKVTDLKVMDWTHNRKGKFPLTATAERIEAAITQWASARVECQRIEAEQAEQDAIKGQVEAEQMQEAQERFESEHDGEH